MRTSEVVCNLVLFGAQALFLTPGVDHYYKKAIMKKLPLTKKTDVAMTKDCSMDKNRIVFN